MFPTVICSLASSSTVCLAVARHKEDISWLVEHVDTPFFAYQTENSSGSDPLVRRNRNGAMEASAYLRYIAEYYDCLPEVVTEEHYKNSIIEPSYTQAQSSTQNLPSCVGSQIALHINNHGS